jgi:hypothetical protein
MPSTIGNIAAVETETASQLDWRLAVRRIASKPAETIQRCLLCERLSAQSLCKQKYENKRSRHRCDASQNPAEKSEGDAGW